MTHSNTISLRCAAVRALSFIVNDKGQNIRAEWKGESATLPDSLARHEIEVREAALYFDAAGVLDLTKWLAIRQEREALYADYDRQLDALLAAADTAAGERPECHMTTFIHGSKFSATTSTHRKPLDHSAIYEQYIKWEKGKGLWVGGKCLRKSNGDDCPPEIQAYIDYDTARHDYMHAHGWTEIETQVDIWDDLSYEARMAITLCPAKSVQDMSAKIDCLLAHWEGQLEHEVMLSIMGLQSDLTALQNETQMRGAA